MTDPHKLLILKAYYMGHAITEKKSNVGQALRMAEKAIASLESKEDEKNQVRLLYYLLLKAEILRSTHEVAASVRRRRRYANDWVAGSLAITWQLRKPLKLGRRPMGLEPE